MSPPAAACLSRRAARSPRASSARAPSASRWAQGFDAMTVPKVALAPHGMTDTAAPRLPHPYLLFLGDTTEPSFAKTAFGLADLTAARCVGQTAAPGLPGTTGSTDRRPG